MNFSSILDISSFFIGMIINLILVSLMCYYFKRKYEILEIAQTEQAKILYDLLKRDTVKNSKEFSENLNEKVDYTKDPLLKPRVLDSDSESEDSDSDSDIEFTLPPNPPASPQPKIIHLDPEPKVESEPIVETKVEETIEINMEEIEIKEITLDLGEPVLEAETNYSKMSIKQLKDLLTSKGVKHKNNMKKDELLDLVKEIDSDVTI